MAIPTNTGFEVGTSLPIDTRLVLKKSEMVNINDDTMPSVYFCICSTDGAVYVYNKSNEKLDTIGRFRKLLVDISKSEYKTLQDEGSWEKDVTYFVSDK